MSIFVRARFEVRDGRRAEFEEIARALCACSAEEPGTRTYRFFAGEDGGYVALEEYADSAAAVAHQANVAELLARVVECADMTAADVCGSVGPEIRAWAATRPQVVLYDELGASEA